MDRSHSPNRILVLVLALAALLLVLRQVVRAGDGVAAAESPVPAGVERQTP